MNPLQTIPNLPPAISVDGTEQFWISQAGVDRRATLAMVLTPPSAVGRIPVLLTMFGTDPASIATADALALSLGGYVDFSNALITLTQNTVLNAPWRKVAGIGMFTTGAFSLTGDISTGPFEQAFDPIGPGAVTITGDGFALGVSPWNCGAGGLDDTAAWNRSAAIAGVSARGWICRSKGHLFTHAGPIFCPTTVPFVDMLDCKLQYTGVDQTIAQITFGIIGANWRPSYAYLPYTQRTTASDWTVAGCIGTLIYNLKDCTDCQWAGGQSARVQCQLYAGPGLGFAYNNIRLGATNGGCQYALELTNSGGGFLNHNLFLGADFFTSPATLPNLDRAGIHLTSVDGTNYQNDNIFIGSALQVAKPTTGTGRADLIFCEYGTYNVFENVRAEALNANIFRSTNDSDLNKVSYTYSTAATAKSQEGRYAANTVLAGSLNGADDAAISTQGRADWTSRAGNEMHETSAGSGALVGFCAISSATTPVYTFGATTFAFHPHYAIVNAGGPVLARRITTRAAKLFTMMVTAAPGFPGRRRFRPLDDWDGSVAWSANIRANGAAQNLGDLVQISGVPGLGLFCLTAGTNALAPPTIPHQIGVCVADGTTVWVVIAAPVRGPFNNALNYQTAFGGSWFEGADATTPLAFSVERHGVLPTVAVSTTVTLGQHYATANNNTTYLVATAVGGGTAPGSTGITASAAPTYNLLPGQTTVDGTVAWTAFAEVSKVEACVGSGTAILKMLGMTIKAGDVGEVVTANPMGLGEDLRYVSAAPTTQGKYSAGEMLPNVAAITATTADWRCSAAGVMTNTAYAAGPVTTDKVYSNAGNAYLCVLGGTAANAPISTTPGVFTGADNVSWQYLGALATIIPGPKNQ